MSREADRRSQKLFPFVKMLENHGGVLICIQPNCIKVLAPSICNVIQPCGLHVKTTQLVLRQYLYRNILNTVKIKKNGTPQIVTFITLIIVGFLRPDSSWFNWWVSFAPDD